MWYEVIFLRVVLLQLSSGFPVLISLKQSRQDNRQRRYGDDKTESSEQELTYFVDWTIYTVPDPSTLTRVMLRTEQVCAGGTVMAAANPVLPVCLSIWAKAFMYQLALLARYVNVPGRLSDYFMSNPSDTGGFSECLTALNGGYTMSNSHLQNRER